MAMIRCPRCGNFISDKAPKCVHCGFMLAEDIKFCRECGEELEAGAIICGMCGCPIGSIEIKDEKEPQQTVLVKSKSKGKSKAKVHKGLLVTILILAIIAIYGAWQVKKHEDNKKYQAALDKYRIDFELAAMAIHALTEPAEACGKLIKDVWYNAIYEKADITTDEYTRPNGYFVSDFNIALDNLFSDEGFIIIINNVKASQELVHSSIKKLKSPPAEYQDAYEALIDLYDAYIDLSNIVINPSGTLNTFSDNLTSAINKVYKNYDKVALYVDIE